MQAPCTFGAYLVLQLNQLIPSILMNTITIPVQITVIVALQTWYIVPIAALDSVHLTGPLHCRHTIHILVHYTTPPVYLLPGDHISGSAYPLVGLTWLNQHGNLLATLKQLRYNQIILCYGDCDNFNFKCISPSSLIPWSLIKSPWSCLISAYGIVLQMEHL